LSQLYTYIYSPERIHNVHWTDEFVHRLSSDPGVVSLAKSLLGTDQVKIFNTRIFCKPPKVGKMIHWHQDSYYVTLTEEKTINWWIGKNHI
jgi:ectoine hydroxylase-related dioxygenase (phytanoyl-CoA dioxygenase family)